MHTRKVSRFPRKVNPFFDDFFTGFFNSGGGFRPEVQSQNKPSINIRKKEDGFEVELAAPGLKKEDFNVEVDKDQLIISADVSESSEEKKEGYTRREFNYQSFSRSFHLPEVADLENISASYDAGVLRISIPLKENEVLKARAITVK